ncbi:hypothetical protein [Actinomadura monticuli]|uniref:Uncharacterized protein n=1 Tax=Actinomadura monticuli TaxID=3097367 RepID=A0ABV4QIH3_9ACTN
MRRGEKAPMGGFPADLARRHGVGAPVPDWTQIIAAAWPGLA